MSLSPRFEVGKMIDSWGVISEDEMKENTCNLPTNDNRFNIQDSTCGGIPTNGNGILKCQDINVSSKITNQTQSDTRDISARVFRSHHLWDK